jgi:rhodanese-related sulfurtransferase
MVSNAPRMTKEDLKEKIGSRDVVLLDVRADKDWVGSDMKIKSAVREDPRELDDWVTKYPKNKTMVLYCA